MQSIERKALSALSEWLQLVPTEVVMNPPIDLKILGSYWGVKAIVERELDVAGLLYRMDKRSSMIFLNEKDILGRKRFSWAHELGHIVMAMHDSPQVDCRKSLKHDRDLERSCDVIATQILMPKDLFVTAANQLGWSLVAVRQLASTFQVTIQAAARRLLELYDEPVFMAVWRPQTDPALHGFKYSWGIANPSGKPFRPQVKWQTGPEVMSPIYQAAHSAAVITGRSKVLLRVNGESLYKWVTTEAMSVGRGNKQSLLGLHYLTQNAT